jgi:hypothetical protein
VRVLLLSLLLSVPVFAAETPELPAGLPPTRSADERRAVLELMRQNRQKYGEDAALLQGLLLTHALQGEAVLTTESTIVGFEEHEGRKYVTFHLTSGIVLDDKSLDREQRLERIWHIILERTLLRYPKFSTPADGVAIEIEYSHRPYQQLADLYDDADDTGTVERAKFYMLSSDLTELLAHQLGTQDFLERSRVLLDNRPAKLRLMEVSLPPRPPTAERH